MSPQELKSIACFIGMASTLSTLGCDNSSPDAPPLWEGIAIHRAIGALNFY